MTTTPDFDEAYKNKWDERYKSAAYAYGTSPNIFFKEWLQQFPPGSILMPAEGEGRNGVFAAQSGWRVTAFDLSVEGQAKALQLAAANHVTMEYIVGDLAQLDFEKESFDAIGLIYAHFAADKKSLFHSKLHSYLKPGGVIILEAFSKGNINNPAGPKDVEMLLSAAEIKTDFENYEQLMLTEEDILLDEGTYHAGKGAVVRFVGRKLP